MCFPSCVTRNAGLCPYVDFRNTRSDLGERRAWHTVVTYGDRTSQRAFLWHFCGCDTNYPRAMYFGVASVPTRGCRAACKVGLAFGLGAFLILRPATNASLMALFCFVLPCLVLPCLVSSRPVQSGSVRSGPVRPVLSCPGLTVYLCRCCVVPVLSCPVLSCPVLSCPVLSCPVLSWLGLWFLV